MTRKRIRFGIIGLGLMGKEFACSVTRWCNLISEDPVPVIAGICDIKEQNLRWFKDNFQQIEIISGDYKTLLKSEKIDAVYCAVPHNLQEQIYIDVINSKKHLLGEKPFGIDKRANENILKAVRANPDIIVRCSSEFPYYPAATEVVKWLRAKKYGRIMEVRAGFHHSSDMDLAKPVNWKRRVEFNGEYGCMGDLGMHVLHIPLKMNWKIKNVFADLQKIVDLRADEEGRMVSCDTWDNAVLTCRSTDPFNGKEFSLLLETKRMAPGATNSWFIEVYGTEGSAVFNTHNPKAFIYLETKGREQGWTSVDVGSQSYIPSVQGAIFETGFSDAFQQMAGAFLHEFGNGGSQHPFGNVTPEETSISHRIFTAALESHETGRRIELE